MKATERIHGFDALRTIAMWLGIMLHAIIAYKAIPEPNWPHDALSSSVLEWLYGYIHQFRMPLFFMVAGFFARMVLQRSGLRHFAVQRFKRIVVPFLGGLFLIVPFTLLPFHYFKYRYTDHLAQAQALHNSFTQLFHWNGLVHLWFLYYLILFYVISIAAWHLFTRTRFKWQQASNPVRFQVSLLYIAVACILLFIVLLCYQTALPPVYTGIKPNLLYLLYYGLFYLGGWIVQANTNIPRLFMRYGLLLFITGTVLSIAIFGTAGQLPLKMTYLCSAVQTVLLCTGLTGLLVRYCQAESRVWRYFADASYWVYLVHLFLVAALQVLLLHVPLPVVIKPLVVLCCTALVSLASYQWLVRYTLIGNCLHGKRQKAKKQPVTENWPLKEVTAK